MNGWRLFRIGLLAVLIIGISLVHYFTPLHHPALHDIFQRLYYIPIILAAFWYGLRGGLLISILVSILYIPHVVFQWGGELAIELEKYLEIVLYNIVGAVTGLLAEREALRRVELEKTAIGLEESYHKLQAQTEQLIMIEEQLRRTERLSTLGEMSATLAHEIRNPLGSIKGTAEILADSFAPGDRQYEFLQILVRETDRLNRVVEEFLHFARPMPVETAECDLLEELRSVVSLVSSEATGRGVSLVMEETPLPPIQADRERLRQVFLNLLLNALQATGRGGRITLSTSVEKGDDGAPVWILLSFADTGEGIAAEHLPRIFEPFFSTKQKGTGLGLAITQKIIESHGGTITVDSTPGRGTTFTVKLPV